MAVNFLTLRSAVTNNMAVQHLTYSTMVGHPTASHQTVQAIVTSSIMTSGHVGIGTTIPLFGPALNVVGSTMISGNVSIDGRAVITSSIMTLGHVGIGTTIPLSGTALNIVGSTMISGNVSIVGGATGDPLRVNNNKTGNDSNPSLILRNNMAPTPSQLGFILKTASAGIYHTLVQTGDHLLLSFDQNNGVAGANGIVIGGWNQTAGLRIGATSSAFNGSLSINGDITASRIIANSYNATDDRSISPSEIPTNSVKPFFSSWDNNSSGFYADAIGFNTWSDGSGGNSNLLMIYKNGFGIRQYQAAFGSATRFSSYKDVQMVESNGDVNIDGRELRISQMASGQCQFRIKSGNTNISSMLHCNGDGLYFLCSDNGNWTSNYNTLRPLTMSLTTGAVTMAHGLTVSGTVSASNISTTTYNGTNMRYVKVGNDDSPNGGVGYNAGYVVLVGGLCIQWGMKSSQNGYYQWPSYIIFPIAFTTVYICMGCSGYGAASGPGSLSNTGCHFSAGGNTVTYIAIGYYNG